MYTPGTSVFHRLPVGVKYLVMIALAVPPIVVRTVPVTIVFLVAAVLCLLIARAGRRALRLPWGLLFMLAFLAGYQFFFGTWQTGVVSAGVIVIALYASRLVMCTTPTAALLDALTTFLQPLRHVRARPERIALAVGLMLRSIPFLIGSVSDVSDALRARGRRANPALHLTPVVIRAVRFAFATGEALAARGLPDDREPDRPRTRLGA
jgi:biotin transport system permease protein